MPDSTETPEGFTLNSRGQGHAVCARRPRIAPPPMLPTLKGSNNSVPSYRRKKAETTFYRLYIKAYFIFEESRITGVSGLVLAPAD